MKNINKCGLYIAINKEIDRLTDESNDFDENTFCDQIDELYPPYIIAGITINASRILKECDPIALRELALSLDDDRQSEIANKIDNLKYVLKHKSSGDGCPFSDFMSGYDLDDLDYDCKYC